MDAVDVAILVLRLLLVGLLYLFLWFVVRSAWRSLQPRSEASAPQAVVTPSSQRNANLRLLVLEPGASDLPPGGVIEVADGATFGRAERSSIVVADPAVSAEHARLVRTRDEWLIADLGSTNGTLVNQSLVDGEATLEPGDIVGLGNVRLKVVGR
ncbi:MAG TPA: FHA domain-containing protein [Chloroflexota bacterium]|jgi:predicted component of type VI protein secretion system|nr:FHA domain-containing protein [Chloroflexota bacterium]